MRCLNTKPPNYHSSVSPAPSSLPVPSGEMAKARETILKYRHLSEEQKAKLLSALEAKQSGPPGPSGQPQLTDALRTEVGQNKG